MLNQAPHFCARKYLIKNRLLTCIREDNEECSIKAHKIFRKILIKLFKHYKEVNSQTETPTPPS